MKTLKTIFAVIVMTIATVLMSSEVSAQKLSNQQLEAVAAELTKQLPMAVEKGMTWTAIRFNSASATMNMTFKIDPSLMGISLDQAKKELNGMSNSDFRELVGQEFTDMMNLLGCKVQVIFEYPDKTTKKFLFEQ